MDRISELHVDLLIKILSFLPTKVAVSTSLLSKRWECLWMWLPKLNYDDSETEGQRLQSFLDIYLPLHRAPTIESLCLKLGHSHFKPQDIKLLVAIAVSRNITELKISYSSVRVESGLSRLQSNLYVCQSLVMLKLSGEILVDVPRLACLASLKTLQLQNVRYFNEGSFHRLLSICPVLEHLSVDRCIDDNMGNFTVISRSLESLSILIHDDCHLDGYVIHTPSLNHFKLKDRNDKSHYCLIESMPTLKKAYIDVEFPDIKSLIGSITAVNRLLICSKAVNCDAIVFNQLEHLELCVYREDSLDFLVWLLNKSPNLRVLDLFVMDDHDGRETRDSWNQPSTVPECLLSSLQTFKWSGYEGSPEERDVVVYILQNARHLKTAIILSEVNKVTKLQMTKELLLSSRASTACRLTFD